MLSGWDDFPIHQVAETIRHVGTSDRNFYDRYYFNLHGSSDELFLVMGMGQYPNLSVQDAFAVVRYGTGHHVVRASKTLGDRMDTRVGPFHVEVQEPLHELRCLLEASEHDLAFDLTWEGAIPAFEEPRQYVRRHGRVLFDTMRFAQTGCWTGEIEVAGQRITVTPDRFKGTRDRSWGVRPVGEPEPPGIRHGELPLQGLWNYAPMQFDDFSILYMVNEHDGGERLLDEGVRIWADPDREPEWLGSPVHEHELISGTRRIRTSLLRFPAAPGGEIKVRVTPLTELHVGVGTGYGFDADWRHGMYQGELVVQGLRLDVEKDADRMIGLVDTCSRFDLEGPSGSCTGYGLHEYMFLGPFRHYGLSDFGDGAP